MYFKSLYMYEIYACLVLCLTHYYSISAGFDQTGRQMALQFDDYNRTCSSCLLPLFTLPVIVLRFFYK